MIQQADLAGCLGLFDILDDAVIAANRADRVVSLNQVAEELFGVRRSQACGRLLKEVIGQPAEPIGFDELCGKGTGQARHTWSAELEGGGGSRRTIEYRTELLELPDLGTCGTVVIAREITERVRVEKALTRAHHDWQAIFEALGHPTLILDKDHAILAANQAVVKATGLPVEELRGRKCYEVFHHGNHSPGACPLRRMVESGRLESMDMELEALDGWFMVSCTPILDENGTIEKVIHIATDITERKQAETALQQSERRFRALFENAPTGAAMLDLAGRLVLTNRALQQTLGYSRTELLELRFNDLVDPTTYDDEVHLFEDLVTGQRESFMMLKRALHKDGRLLWGNLAVSLIRDKEGAPKNIIAMFQDITEQKRAEEEREHLEMQLRQQQKLEAIGTLAAGVAHEINNPISGIMNYAQLIACRSDVDDRARRHAEQITREGERIAGIVRHLLAFARQEKQSYSPAQLRDIVDATLNLIRTVMVKDQITLEVDIPDDLPAVTCKSQQIQQVLMNLLTNARDAVNERYPHYDEDKVIRIQTRLLDKNGECWARTTVEDRGMGIASDIADRIFDPFFTTKPLDRGTGLGLAVSYGIVKEHRGELGMESEPGRYCRFHLDLPVGRNKIM